MSFLVIFLGKKAHLAGSFFVPIFRERAAGGGGKIGFSHSSIGSAKGQRAQQDPQKADADDLIPWVLPIRGPDDKFLAGDH